MVEDNHRKFRKIKDRTLLLKESIFGFLHYLLKLLNFFILFLRQFHCNHFSESEKKNMQGVK